MSYTLDDLMEAVNNGTTTSVSATAKAAKATADHVTAEHNETRVSVISAIAKGLKSIFGWHEETRQHVTREHETTRTHVTREHETTRTHVSDEHNNTRNHVTSEANRVIDAVSDRAAAAWQYVLAVIALLATGHFSYGVLADFYTKPVLDAAGNLVGTTPNLPMVWIVAVILMLTAFFATLSITHLFRGRRH